jgi:hypothetical protein
MLSTFWSWYEKHLAVNIAIAAGLFILQLVHLYWLTTSVVWHKLTGISHFEPTGIFGILILLVDYTEIPALIATSLLYINDYSLIYLVLLNSQWIHLFWITDEYIIEKFFNIPGIGIPILLAWIAILIDYLELPVIYDTIKRLFGKEGLRALLDRD